MLHFLPRLLRSSGSWPRAWHGGVCWTNGINSTRHAYSSSMRCFSVQSPESESDTGINKTIIIKPASMSLRYGQPVISIPLPTSKQHCDVYIKPLTETVEDFLNNIKAEDGGVTTAALYSKDGNRMSITSTMDHVLLSDFQLDINGIKYDIKIPDDYGQKLLENSEDHIKDIVHRLYAALHMDEFQLKKHQEMNGQLENLKAELLPLEQQRIKLDETTRGRTNTLLWLGMGAMSLQFGFFAQLTWGEYSWDIMEPITYFTTCATLIGIYVYFALIRQEYLYNEAEDRLYLRRFHWIARKRGFDIHKYNHLKDAIDKLDGELKRIEGPMKLNLPTQPLAEDQ